MVLPWAKYIVTYSLNSSLLLHMHILFVIQTLPSGYLLQLPRNPIHSLNHPSPVMRLPVAIRLCPLPSSPLLASAMPMYENNSRFALKTSPWDPIDTRYHKPIINPLIKPLAPEKHIELKHLLYSIWFKGKWSNLHPKWTNQKIIADFMSTHGVGENGVTVSDATPGSENNGGVSGAGPSGGAGRGARWR